MDALKVKGSAIIKVAHYAKKQPELLKEISTESTIAKKLQIEDFTENENNFIISKNHPLLMCLAAMDIPVKS